MIEGDKINLKEIEESDLSKMMQWRNKTGIRKWFFDKSRLTMEKQKKWYRKYLLNDYDKMFIIETKDGIPIGTVGLNSIDYKNKKSEFGRMILGLEKYHGKGFAKDATMALLKFAFKTMGMNRIYLFVIETNKRAMSLYKKCGFKQEGILRKDFLDNGVFKNVIIMGILKKDYIKEYNISKKII